MRWIVRIAASRLPAMFDPKPKVAGWLKANLDDLAKEAGQPNVGSPRTDLAEPIDLSVRYPTDDLLHGQRTRDT